MEQVTGAPSPSFACVGLHTRHPRTWAALAVSTSALLPSLSLICGILCAAYHLCRAYSSENSTSLWALSEAVTGTVEAAAAAMPAGAEPPCAAGARVHPADGASRRRSRVSMRVSMRAVRSVLGARPQLGPVVAHHAAAFAYFAVDVTFAICLWVEIVHATLVAVPHLDIFVPVMLANALAAAAKAWLVVGRFGRPWAAATGQVRRSFVSIMSVALLCQVDV